MFRKTLQAAAVLVAFAASPVLAEEVKFGSTACQADTSGCVIFFGPMSEENLEAAGMTMTAMAELNDLVDLKPGNDLPAMTWFVPAG